MRKRRASLAGTWGPRRIDRQDSVGLCEWSRTGGELSEEELEKMKDDYYRILGLDTKTGAPTREGLEKLDLPDVADRIGL